MREKRKDEVLRPGFLLDRDVSKVASLFPKKRTKTIADIGLPQNATDAEIVKAAFDRQLTIVTGNASPLLICNPKFEPQPYFPFSYDRGTTVAPICCNIPS
jgi:hypothetical protein